MDARADITPSDGPHSGADITAKSGSVGAAHDPANVNAHAWPKHAANSEPDCPPDQRHVPSDLLLCRLQWCMRVGPRGITLPPW